VLTAPLRCLARHRAPVAAPRYAGHTCRRLTATQQPFDRWDERRRRCLDQHADRRLRVRGQAGPSTSSRRLDRLGLRSGAAVAWHRFACSWVMPRRRPGILIGGSRRSVSGQRRSRGCISAVGRPLCQVYGLTGASWRSRLAASRSHAGNDVKRAGGSGLEVAAEAADPGHAGKFGGGEDK
jgi:hypothetical protein